MLVINQFFATITGSKARDLPSAMLADSAYQVIGHASIKNGAIFVGHNVDPEIVVSRHSASLSIIRRARETFSNLPWDKLEIPRSEPDWRIRSE